MKNMQQGFVVPIIIAAAALIAIGGGIFIYNQSNFQELKSSNLIHQDNSDKQNGNFSVNQDDDSPQVTINEGGVQDQEPAQNTVVTTDASPTSNTKREVSLNSRTYDVQKIAAGDLQEYSFFISPSEGGFLVTLRLEGNDTDSVSIRLESPSGKKITFNDSFKDGESGLVFFHQLDEPEVGKWSLTLENLENKVVESLLQISGRTNIVTMPHRDTLRLKPKTNFVLVASVVEIGAGQLSNLSVTAELYDEKMNLLRKLPMRRMTSDDIEITTVDDFSDEKLLPYTYITPPISALNPGAYYVYYALKGTDSKGNSFLEHSIDSQYIMVSSGNAHFFSGASSVVEQGISTKEIGITSVITFDFLIYFEKLGIYNLTATAISPNGAETRLNTRFEASSETSRVTLLLDLADFEENKVSDGHYSLKDIYLWEENVRSRWVDEWRMGDNKIYQSQYYTVK